MKKLVFVCLGNICHSPMAEFVMKSMTDNYEIQSRATSSWEHGNPIHKGTQGIFQQYQIPYEKGQETVKIRFTYLHLKVFQILGIQEILKRLIGVFKRDAKCG